MATALICGSLTYDTVIVLEEKFKNHLIPQEHPSGFEIHFMVPDLRRQFGGSAGNIAYSLKKLGAIPLPLATVGMDFGPYAEWLDTQGISRNYIKRMDHCYTPQTFFIRDMDDNQLIAFHPGALNFSQYHRVTSPLSEEVNIGIISADSIEGMTAHALQLIEAGIPFIFDPGSTIHQFDGDDLLKFIEQATWILVNQKEWQVMELRTGLTATQMARRVQALIITRDAEGPLIYSQETCYQIPSAQAKAVNDTAGCGDAFCAGLLYGLLKDIDWETTGRIASLMGAIKVEHHGSQNHLFTLEMFKLRFKKNFGYALMI